MEYEMVGGSMERERQEKCKLKKELLRRPKRGR
jgi:hypothetical protein